MTVVNDEGTGFPSGFDAKTIGFLFVHRSILICVVVVFYCTSYLVSGIRTLYINLYLKHKKLIYLMG